MIDILIAALLVIGGIFGLIGSFGLLKLRVPMQRLHAPTKATTIGVGTALFASVLDLWVFQATLSWQELLVMAFLFLTAPITALFLAKAHLHLTVPRDALPPTGTAQPWATHAPPDGDD
jgi:multicomponent K+:H+ antiporter subunit G